MENVVVRFAATPAGQWTCQKTDMMLVYLNEAVMWSMQAGSHSLHWAMFLPLMLSIQWTRIILSAVLFVSFGKTISKKDIQGIIMPTQEIVKDIQQKGLQRREELEDEPTDNKLDDFVLYTKTNNWLLRPINKLVKNALYAFGLVDKAALEEKNNEEQKDFEQKEQSEEQTEGSSEQQNEQQQQHEEHNQEHHHH